MKRFSGYFIYKSNVCCCQDNSDLKIFDNKNKIVVNKLHSKVPTNNYPIIGFSRRKL